MCPNHAEQVMASLNSQKEKRERTIADWVEEKTYNPRKAGNSRCLSRGTSE
jgi:hypothetical protein